MNTAERFYKTSDIVIASVLTVFGFEIFNVDKTNPRRVEFIFENSPKINEVVQNYEKRRLSVEPQMLFFCVRSLKSRIYSP